MDIGNEKGADMRFKIVKNEEDLDLCYKLRELIFIQEQNVPIEMEKDKDDGLATHFLLFDVKKPIGVGRVVAKSNIAVVGRLGVLKEYRGKGAGFRLMQEIIGYCRAEGYIKIILGAQEHALDFYKKIGFEVCSDRYMDANIPHYKMQFSLQLA